MLKKMVKNLLLLVLVGVLTTGLAGCALKKDDASSKLYENEVEKIKSEGKIVLGTSADYPPYEFHEEIEGKDVIVGFDIEIAKEVASDLGVELVIKDMKFEGLLAALDSGNVDFVIAGMTPTPDREKNVDFSKIYYKAVQAVIVRTEDKDKIKSLDDLIGKKIGVQKGSIQEGIAREQIIGGNIKALGKVTDLMLELKNKKIDAIVVEKPVANAYASENSDIVVTDIKFIEEEGGSAVALKKGNVELVNKINNTIDRLINDNLIDYFYNEAEDRDE